MGQLSVNSSLTERLCCLNRNTVHAVYSKYQLNLNFGLFLGVKTCEVFLCFVAIPLRLGSIMLTLLFSLCYVTGEYQSFLHRGWAKFWVKTFSITSTVFVAVAALNISAFTFEWKPLMCQASKSFLRLFCPTWSTWYN